MQHRYKNSNVVRLSPFIYAWVVVHLQSYKPIRRVNNFNTIDIILISKIVIKNNTIISPKLFVSRLFA